MSRQITVDFDLPRLVEDRARLLGQLHRAARRCGSHATVRVAPDMTPPERIDPAEICGPYNPAKARGVGGRWS